MPIPHSIYTEIPEEWIGIEEAAEYLGVKPITVRDWIKKRYRNSRP